MSTDLQRIQRDIAGCKAKIAQMEAGQRGVISESYRHQGPGQAQENQLRAQRQALERFELEYVNAMLAEHKWVAADVIAAMARPKPEATDDDDESRSPEGYLGAPGGN